ncbi:MAG: LapA family protein [Firmicutes bacterium]|jgi:putative membrane protein|nr:LapA family protein [Bacillota bacterium]
MSILVLALVCALLVAVFAVQNSVPVAVTFLTWRFEMSLVLVILGSAALGAVAVFLLAMLRLMRQGRLLREANQKARRLQDELAKLQVQLDSQSMADEPRQNEERTSDE